MPPRACAANRHVQSAVVARVRAEEMCHLIAPGGRRALAAESAAAPPAAIHDTGELGRRASAMSGFAAESTSRDARHANRSCVPGVSRDRHVDSPSRSIRFLVRHDDALVLRRDRRRHDAFAVDDGHGLVHHAAHRVSEEHAPSLGRVQRVRDEHVVARPRSPTAAAGRSPLCSRRSCRREAVSSQSAGEPGAGTNSVTLLSFRIAHHAA